VEDHRQAGSWPRSRAPARCCGRLLHDYQRQRVLTLLDPSQDPLGAGYHIIQSTIAVGSGGLLGKGWLNGTQTHLDFSRSAHRLHLRRLLEEFGLIGNIVLLALYLLLIGAGW
jgi:rod shape determining protein RodA